MNTNEQQARSSLAQLVAHVFAHLNGPIRGLPYQTVKYGALLAAMSQDHRYHIPSAIRSVLVLTSKLPAEYKTTAEVLGVEVIENVVSKQ